MTDRPATPASAGSFSDPLRSELSQEPTDRTYSADAPPDLSRCRCDCDRLTPSDTPPPLPVAATSPSSADRLLAADPDRLPGYDPAPLTDPGRPPAEVRALSLALGCPDLFLADVDPGPDQHLFAAELAAEAVRSGERVLIVTTTPADAEAVHARLDPVLPAALARDDLAEQLQILTDAHTDILARFDARARKLAADLEAKRKELAALRDHSSRRGGVLALVKGFFSHKTVEDSEPQARAAEESARRLEAEAAQLAVERGQVEANYLTARDLIRRDDYRFARLGPARVIVATLDLVDTLTHSPDSPAFERLVLTDADNLNESEFTHAARSAARSVLIGDASGPSPQDGRPRFFHRLWAHLHREVWAHESGRLIARLADADPDRLTCEPLADRPEIELRFTRDADGEPVLAEVAFPSTTVTAEAKTFLAAELGEVRLSPCGPVHWEESDDQLAACWPAADAPHADWAELAPGVREKVIGTGADCRTAAVSFDRAAGWDRESAADWLTRHAGPGPRTAVLPRPSVLASTPALAAGVPG